MVWSVRCLIVSMLLSYSCVFAYADATVDDMVVTMRDSGYTIGDVIDMTVTFTLPMSQKIDENSLPLVGRVRSWLDIQSIQVTQHQQLVRLKMRWQLFASVEIAQRLKTPEIVLKTTGKPVQTIIIPQQTFYYSPVLPMPPIKDIKRRANLAPPSFDTAEPAIYFSVCFGLFFLCGFLWLWLKNRLTWLPYQAGPMAQLLRKLKRTTSSTGFNEQQLRDIHAALNESAGVSLYPHNLSRLFTHAPYFSNEINNVIQFFNQSWTHFYKDATLQPEPIDVTSTKQWIQRVAIAEQLFIRSLGYFRGRHSR